MAPVCEQTNKVREVLSVISLGIYVTEVLRIERVLIQETWKCLEIWIFLY